MSGPFSALDLRRPALPLSVHLWLELLYQEGGFTSAHVRDGICVTDGHLGIWMGRAALTGVDGWQFGEAKPWQAERVDATFFGDAELVGAVDPALLHEICEVPELEICPECRGLRDCAVVCPCCGQDLEDQLCEICEGRGSFRLWASNRHRDGLLRVAGREFHRLVISLAVAGARGLLTVHRVLPHALRLAGRVDGDAEFLAAVMPLVEEEREAFELELIPSPASSPAQRSSA